METQLNHRSQSSQLEQGEWEPGDGGGDDAGLNSNDGGDSGQEGTDLRKMFRKNLRGFPTELGT